MDIDTGKIYYDEEAVAAARKRGERLVEITEMQAKQMEVAQAIYPSGLNRKERRKLDALHRRRKVDQVRR